MEGTGKKMRHIKIHSIEDTARIEIHDIIKKALAERKITMK